MSEHYVPDGAGPVVAAAVRATSRCRVPVGFVAPSR